MTTVHWITIGLLLAAIVVMIISHISGRKVLKALQDVTAEHNATSERIRTDMEALILLYRDILGGHNGQTHD